MTDDQINKQVDYILRNYQKQALSVINQIQYISLRQFQVIMNSLLIVALCLSQFAIATAQVGARAEAIASAIASGDSQAAATAIAEAEAAGENEAVALATAEAIASGNSKALAEAAATAVAQGADSTAIAQSIAQAVAGDEHDQGGVDTEGLKNQLEGGTGNADAIANSVAQTVNGRAIAFSNANAQAFNDLSTAVSQAFAEAFAVVLGGGDATAAAAASASAVATATATAVASANVFMAVEGQGEAVGEASAVAKAVAKAVAEAVASAAAVAFADCTGDSGAIANALAAAEASATAVDIEEAIASAYVSAISSSNDPTGFATSSASADAIAEATATAYVSVCVSVLAFVKDGCTVAVAQGDAYSYASGDNADTSATTYTTVEITVPCPISKCFDFLVGSCCDEGVTVDSVCSRNNNDFKFKGTCDSGAGVLAQLSPFGSEVFECYCD
eukprot:TRINITY_DN18_c0_g1_i15.p1 TRINITY_DN18_c0_g1~~TRINITY_DN18_c0_g1_i15.p1  ORF type:complete len:473 (+),score=84.09 TRINITY_DN18_c0_g1_i15:76-1419(+)